MRGQDQQSEINLVCLCLESAVGVHLKKKCFFTSLYLKFLVFCCAERPRKQFFKIFVLLVSVFAQPKR